MHHSRGKSKNSKISAAPKQKISYEKKVDPAITEYSVRALNWLRKAEFLMSAPKLNLCVEDTGYEIAFAGRSNAGKSSAINALTNQKQLARASKKPGRTQMINFFSLGNPDQRLVDLPGYGYAQTPLSVKEHWNRLLSKYLQERDQLKGLVLMVDIRRGLTELDVQMIQWFVPLARPIHVLLTKCDKLTRNDANKTLFAVRKQLQELAGDWGTVQLFSSTNRVGLEQAGEIIGQWIMQARPESSTTESERTEPN